MACPGIRRSWNFNLPIFFLFRHLSPTDSPRCASSAGSSYFKISSKSLICFIIERQIECSIWTYLGRIEKRRRTAWRRSEARPGSSRSVRCFSCLGGAGAGAWMFALILYECLHRYCMIACNTAMGVRDCMHWDSEAHALLHWGCRVGYTAALEVQSWLNWECRVDCIGGISLILI